MYCNVGDFTVNSINQKFHSFFGSTHFGTAPEVPKFCWLNSFWVTTPKKRIGVTYSAGVFLVNVLMDLEPCVTYCCRYLILLYGCMFGNASVLLCFFGNNLMFCFGNNLMFPVTSFPGIEDKQYFLKQRASQYLRARLKHF